MALIVETGLVVAGANSFVSLADFQAHCEARGRDLTAYDEDTEQEPALVKMADWLNDQSWIGVKTNRSNPMAWPRYGQEEGGNMWNQLQYPVTYWVGPLDRDGFYVGNNEVPPEVVKAQCEGAWLILTGKDLEPVLDRGGQLKREKYDVVEFEYEAGAPAEQMFTAIRNRLKGLLKSGKRVELARS